MKKQRLILLSSFILIAVIFSILITRGRRKPFEGGRDAGSLEKLNNPQEDMPALQPLNMAEPQGQGQRIKNDARRRIKKDNEILRPKEVVLSPLELSPSEEEQKEAEALGIKLSEEEMRVLEKKNIMLY